MSFRNGFLKGLHIKLISKTSSEGLLTIVPHVCSSNLLQDTNHKTKYQSSLKVRYLTWDFVKCDNKEMLKSCLFSAEGRVEISSNF